MGSIKGRSLQTPLTTSVGAVTTFAGKYPEGTLIDNPFGQPIIELAHVDASTGTESGHSRSSGCFPNGATVRLNSGEKIRMKDLSIGQVVQTGPDTWSEVYGFTHANTESWNTFLSLTTASGKSITLTPGHYVFVNGGNLKLAREVQLDDCLNGTDKVIALKRSVEQGLINPHTMDGKIMVNDIQVSNYTDFLAAGIAHMVLLPWRFLYRVKKVFF
jgi:hypothetical protein